MTRRPPPPPAAPAPGEELTPRLARRILAQMGGSGTPPELGVSHVNVGNESYLGILDREYVSELLGRGEGSAFKLVQGTYGAGKTHFLYCVRDLAWRKNLLCSFVTISPKETPLNKPVGVYRAVAQSLELARGAADAGADGAGDGGGGGGGAADGEADPVRGIDDVLRHRAERVVAEDGADAARAWADAALARAPLTRHSFRDAAVSYLHAVIDGDRAAIRRLGAWLRGEPLPAAEARAVGLYESPGNDNGFALLRSLVQAVARLGFAGSVLLLDEAERRLSIESRHTKAQSESVDHLRELVDLCGRSELPRSLVLYAVTPAFTQNVLPEYPALQQRLGWPVQYLSPHNPKAPLIDLEALDLEPVVLLRALGKRLTRVARRAYDWSPAEPVVMRNLEKLVGAVTYEQLEVSHRRLFVKLWIRLMDELRLGGERDLADDEIRALVRDEQAVLLEEDLSARPTFFGQPVPGGPGDGDDAVARRPGRTGRTRGDVKGDRRGKP